MEQARTNNLHNTSGRTTFKMPSTLTMEKTLVAVLKSFKHCSRRIFFQLQEFPFKEVNQIKSKSINAKVIFLLY